MLSLLTNECPIMSTFKPKSQGDSTNKPRKNPKMDIIAYSIPLNILPLCSNTIHQSLALGPKETTYYHVFSLHYQSWSASGIEHIRCNGFQFSPFHTQIIIGKALSNTTIQLDLKSTRFLRSIGLHEGVGV